MFIDVDNRGAGKTTTLIHDAYFTGLPIVVANEDRRRTIRSQANNMGVNVTVYTVDEMMAEKVKGNQLCDNSVMIDELEDVLFRALGVYVIKANLRRGL